MIQPTIKQLIEMSEEIREPFLERHEDEIEFTALYKKIEAAKTKALDQKKAERYTELVHLKAHIEKWDKLFH